MKASFALAPAWLICLAILTLSWAAGLSAFFQVVPPHQMIPLALAFGLLVLAVQIAWLLSAYSIACTRFGQAGGSVAWLSLGHAILGALGVAVGFTASIEMGMVAFFAAVALYYAALTLVAHAIVKAEQRISQFDSVVGTVLLLAALPLGVWFLRPRIAKLASATM